MKRTVEPRATVSIPSEASGTMTASAGIPSFADAVPAALVRASLVAGERIQLVLAGGLWLVAAAILGIRGIGWLLPVAWTLLLAGTGVLVGTVKARFLLDRVARGVARRIHDRGPDASIVGFLSVRSWVVVVIMMAGGHALRLTATPRPVLGVLYVAIATALVFASRTYWRVLGRGWSTLG
ncbi:MAG: hypothetical protein RQ731_08330 [Anaerosomatales bacterium]|nr:hypothetical protein [Anaerosomatales bacterium]MDT8434744.1 hypothetical protein [Anaerosomatales bacterium]